MVMGNKIVKIEDSYFVIGAYIIQILLRKEQSLDNLFSLFSREYPKKIEFENFVYAIDFLFLIKKIKIRSDDILELIK